MPKSQYGQAIGYVRNQWESLCRYAEDGRLGIDNNISERTLRVAAIGRKNGLFFGSDRGGETAATCLSILASAKRHLIEPFAYVRALLVALAADEADLEALLPDTWIKAHPEYVVQYRRDEAAVRRDDKARRLSRRLEAANPAKGCKSPRTRTQPVDSCTIPCDSTITTQPDDVAVRSPPSRRYPAFEQAWGGCWCGDNDVAYRAGR